MAVKTADKSEDKYEIGGEDVPWWICRGVIRGRVRVMRTL